jgi:hypothetical protein
MAQQESVSVEHGGVTITTNTASEADLRTEMEAPSAPPPDTDAAAAAARARDEKGRFAKTEPAPAAAEAPPETPAESPTEPPAESQARRRDDTLPRHNPLARLNQALAQKAEAERRAAALEAELARVRPPGVTSPVTPAVHTPAALPPAAAIGQPEPQFEQFADDPDPYTAWQDAKWEWRVNQRLAQVRAEWDAEQTAKARAQSFQSRLADGRTQYPDFDQVLTQADTLGLQVSAVMQEAIADSPEAANLVYYLATHPEECTQLAEESQQTPVAAATVMRRLLESRLSPRAAATAGPGAAAKGSVSTAKPPVTPVGSSPVVSDEPPGDTASAAEHARYWNRRLKVPGTR